MLYIFIKDLGSKKVGMKVNMNINKQSTLITCGYVKRFDESEVVEDVIEKPIPPKSVIIKEGDIPKKTRTKKQ